MNCKTINEQIKMLDYLSQKNINPIKIKNDEAWFLSPFRNEKTASFKVNLSTNRFYDFGEGFGGTLIDLICYLENISVKEAISYFNSFSFQQQKEFLIDNFPSQVNKVEIISVKPLFSFVLKNYLLDRGIKSFKAWELVKEINYKLPSGKVFFALGFANDKKGFELRNQYFKGCSSKAMTTIKNNSNKISVFEGFMDYLSFLEMYNYPDNFDYLILNSTSLLSDAINYLQVKNFEEIHLFFDNDLTGNNCTNTMENIFGKSIIDHSISYKNCKDLNDFLISKKK